jgi:two-component system, cell cycle sensor histidine kinase and response regulator CckA
MSDSPHSGLRGTEIGEAMDDLTTPREGPPGKPGPTVGSLQSGELFSRRWPPWLSYVFAVAVTAATMLVRMEIKEPFAEKLFLSLFYLPVILSAYFGGFGPSLVSTLVAAASAKYFLIPPTHTFSIAKGTDLTQWIILIMNCTFISIMSGALHRSWRKAENRTKDFFEANKQLAEEVAERKRAEEATRRQTELLELTHDSISVCDMEGRILYWNSGAAEQYGWPVEEAMGKMIHDLLKTQFPLPLDEIKAGLLKTGYWEGELIHAKRNGSQIIAASRWALQKDGHGNPIAILEINNNITEKKHLEAALAKRERYFRNVVEQATDGIFIHDIDGRMVDCNRRAYESLGYTRDELLQMRVSDFDADFSEKKDVNVWQQLKTGQIFAIEGVHRRKDGSTFPVEIRVALFDPGEPKMIIGIVRDVTERKRAEDVLRESEERLRAAINVAQIGIFDHDQRTDTIHWSPQQREIHGWGPEEPVSLSAFLDLVHPDDRESIAEAVRRAHDPAGGGIWGVEHRIIRRDGSLRWLKERSQTFFEGTGAARRPVRTIGAVLDITDRKRVEEEQEKLQAQLLQAQKMESIGRLAGGVAHDFNNMLGVIMGRVEMTLKQLNPTEPLYHNLQEIQKAAHRSADLTRQLLAFARKQPISPKVLDLNETLLGMLKMLRRLIGEDIELVWVPGAKLWKVKIDPAQIDQILANLAVNARDAISGTGSITLRTNNVVLDAGYCADHPGCVLGEYVLLAVSDTGAGMTREVLDHLFEPFFTTKEVGKGTGLGLATVYGVVKQNNGFIEAASEPGKGTAFKIYLPCAEGEEAEGLPDEAEQELQRGTETILLVEDEQLILDLAKTILDNLGYTVIEASTPQEAIHIAEGYGGNIHLLITDVVMPEMNGRHLAERITTIKPGIKCLYMSGYTADIIARQGVLDRELSFIQKPFRFSDFTKAIRKVLEGK